jgi:hypothetical protein
MRLVRVGARFVALCCAFFFLSPFARAQQRDVDHALHGWGMFFGDHRFGDSPWGLHLEGQWRRTNGFNQWQQLLLRPGIHYVINPRIRLTAGYGYIDTYPYGEFPAVLSKTPEHRIWEQAQVFYKSGKVSMSSRFRFENRFLGQRDRATQELTHYRYENRLRLMQRATVPLTPRYYVAAYDEFWLYVKPYVSASMIDQNRAYIALGRKLNPRWDVEAGYMHQAIWQRNGRVLESNHTLMFAINSRQPFGRR